MVEVIKTDWGIASRAGDKIYLNKKLDKFPALKQSILQHELKHSKGLKPKDIGMDIFNDDIKNNKLEYYKFVLSTPKSWTEFLPITISKKRISFNPTMFLFWALAILLSIVISRMV